MIQRGKLFFSMESYLQLKVKANLMDCLRSTSKATFRFRFTARRNQNEYVCVVIWGEMILRSSWVGAELKFVEIRLEMELGGEV